MPFSMSMTTRGYEPEQHLGSRTGQRGSNHEAEGGSRTGQRGPNHNPEEGVVDPEAGNQSDEGHNIALAAQESVSEDAPQANNPDEVRKSALKISFFVFGIICGGIYSIFSGLSETKGQYNKHLLFACGLLMMVTMLSSVVLMGLAFTSSTREWLIRILNWAKYIPLVLLTLTGLTVAITFQLSLKE